MSKSLRFTMVFPRSQATELRRQVRAWAATNGVSEKKARVPYLRSLVQKAAVESV